MNEEKASSCMRRLLGRHMLPLPKMRLRNNYSNDRGFSCANRERAVTSAASRL